jgi:hypothetical protein
VRIVGNTVLYLLAATCVVIFLAYCYFAFGAIALLMGDASTVAPLANSSATKLKAYVFFWLLGGIWGWAALSILWRSPQRHISRIHPFVWGGIVAGTIAALATGGIRLVSLFPIALCAGLLVRAASVTNVRT